MVSAISSGCSVYMENRLPVCNGHPNRNFLTNGKHPKSNVMKWNQFKVQLI